MLPKAAFCSAILADDPHQRQAYVSDALQQFSKTDLVFFDPDNGLEVRSRPYGSKRSNKYLFWREAQAFFASGKSLLIYQHFIRENREQFIARLSSAFELRLGASIVWAFRTPIVAIRRLGWSTLKMWKRRHRLMTRLQLRAPSNRAVC